MIRYTPYEIFSNQIPVFDINFISPMETAGGDFINKDNKMIILPMYTRLIPNNGTPTDYMDVYCLGMIFNVSNQDSQAVLSDYILEYQFGEDKGKIRAQNYEQLQEAIKKYNLGNDTTTKKVPIKVILELANSWLESRNLEIETINYLGNDYTKTSSCN